MKDFHLVALVIASLESVFGQRALAAHMGPARTEQARRGAVDKAVCVIVDRDWLPDDTRSAFLQGLRRPFQLRDLPVEREGPRGQWHEAGSIHSAFHLAGTPCVDQHVAESLGVVPLVANTVGDSADVAEIAVRVRIGGWSQVIIDYVHHPSDPAPNPEQEINPVGISVEVAICAPESVASNAALSWTSTKVWWREKPSSPTRAEEIHGWMVGMAALQVLQRRWSLLPDSLDLVFESRGRNH